MPPPTLGERRGILSSNSIPRNKRAALLDDDVTAWIDGLRDQETEAVERLWKRYHSQLLSLASRRLPPNIRREFDEEDVALSAMDSLCRGIASGRFPELTDRDSLWALLLVITKRKCRAQVRRHTALKRGGGGARGESVFGFSEEGIAAEVAGAPDPEFVARMSEEVEQLIQALPDEQTRQLAMLKMEGYTNKEAAEKLVSSLTTVERRLRLIRKVWSELL